MIHKNSLSREWIENLGEKLGKADKTLLEKAIRALFLTEQLCLKGLDFQFKGGTSLLLHLPEPNRFSIDADIVTTGSRTQITRILSSLCGEKYFTRWEEDIRTRKTPLPVEHFRVYYHSLFPGFSPENYVLLDVIYQPELPEWSEFRPMEHIWLQTHSDATQLRISTAEGLLGDKLTAFAPTPTGILYLKNRPVETIKQLFDIGVLFEHAADLETVRTVFSSVCDQQIRFRNLSIGTSEVLRDAFQAALTICDRNEKDPDFAFFKKGIANIKPHLLQRFSIEEAVTAAAKVMYLATLLQFPSTQTWVRFSEARDVISLNIPSPDFNRFNRLKKSNPKAFFYLWHCYEARRQLE